MQPKGSPLLPPPPPQTPPGVIIQRAGTVIGPVVVGALVLEDRRHEWEAVTLAHFQKYPNPFATHVLTADVVSRHVDAAGRLHSSRLMLKTDGASFPAWLQALVKMREAYVLEESVVDLRGGTMETRTRNLTLRRFVSVEEVQTYTRSVEENVGTVVDTQAKIHCGMGRWTGVAGRVEGLGVAKFRDHLEKSRKALIYVVERVRSTSSKASTGDASSFGRAAPAAIDTTR